MATLDEFMQAMSGKPTAASRSREFEHKGLNRKPPTLTEIQEAIRVGQLPSAFRSQEPGLQGGVPTETITGLNLSPLDLFGTGIGTKIAGLGAKAIGLAGTFAGVGAKTANLAKLELAQKLKQQGVPDRDIYAKTGWTFGFPDQKPRFEIPDNLATMSSKPLPSEYIESVGVNEPSWKVGQVLDHSGLFSAYPDLKSIRSSFMYGQPESANYKPGMDWISYNAESMKKAVPSIKQQAIIDAHEAYTKAFYDRPDVKAWNDATDSFNFNQPNVDDAFKALSQKYGGSEIDDEAARLAQKSLDFRSLAGGGYALRDAKSPTLHELQHAIQQREGFARGGSPDSVKGLVLPKQQKMLDELASIDKEVNDTGLAFKPSWQLTPEEKALKDRYTHLVQQTQLNAGDQYQAYRSLAGEAEARLTQARMNMTPEQRAASYPLDMFDVPVNEQIVRYDEGNALSSQKPKYDVLKSLLPITTTGLLANQLRQSLWAEPQPD